MSKHTEFKTTLSSPIGTKTISLSGLEIMEICEFYDVYFTIDKDVPKAELCILNHLDYTDIVLDYSDAEKLIA